MIIDTANYGLCLFSPSSMKTFLKNRGRSRKKRLLDLFQNNEDLYKDSLCKGVWLPITPISSIEYEIQLTNEIDSESEFIYSGFNINVGKDDLWICDIGKLSKIEYSIFSNRDYIYYYTLDKKKVINGIRLPIESGRYSVTISGLIKNDTPIFLFNLEPVDSFSDFNDPRDDKYTFFES